MICRRIFPIFGVGDFPFKIPFKVLQFFFFLGGGLASRSGFRAAISDAVARSSIMFRNSICADGSVMAASRLVGAAAACVILLCFAAGHRKSYWNGCIKAAMVICHEIFSILALVIFLLQFLCLKV